MQPCGYFVLKLTAFSVPWNPILRKVTSVYNKHRMYRMTRLKLSISCLICNKAKVSFLNEFYICNVHIFNLLWFKRMIKFAGYTRSVVGHYYLRNFCKKFARSILRKVPQILSYVSDVFLCQQYNVCWATNSAFYIKF